MRQKAKISSYEEFRKAKFGMFIHFGLYSLLGEEAWVMHDKKMPISEYEKLCLKFNPVKFDAKKWVSLAKESQAKYITITTKHHDGFCMYESKLTDYNIVERTPFKRDLIREIAQECHLQGIKLFFYYSQLDWHHPDYFPLGRTGQFSKRKENGIWENYKKYYIDQVRELCENYGKIDGFWFDGHWDKPSADWGHKELYQMIHKLQPHALIGNNHHIFPLPGEDFQIFEQDIPGGNTTGFNCAPISSLPLECAFTINNSWGYKKDDNSHKSVRQLIKLLNMVNSLGANLLLNTGPLPSGEIQKEHVYRFKKIGEYLRHQKWD